MAEGGGGPCSSPTQRAAASGAPRRMQEPQCCQGEVGCSDACWGTAGTVPLSQSRRPAEEVTSSKLLSGNTFAGQQQRHQAQLCSSLLEALRGLPALAQQRHRKSVDLLSPLPQQAAVCTEAGDARGATAAVLSFLRGAAACLGSVSQPQSDPKLRAATAAPARAAVAAVADYCSAGNAANAAELRVLRLAVGCLPPLFRLSPQLAASGSHALREALSVAVAAAVLLHRLLGAEPRPKAGRDPQPHLPQQRQQILAASLATTQPKLADLMRALLLAVNCLLAELVRARSVVAAGGPSFPPRNEGSPFPSADPGDTAGEAGVELLLLLLPLSLAQASAGAQLQQLQLRPPPAAGWGPPSELTADWGSTQESEADASVRGPLLRRGPRGRPSLSWRRGSEQETSDGAPRAPPPQVSPFAAAEAPAEQDAGAPGAPSVRAEALRCIEGLLRLCGRELFPYWSLLLQHRSPCLWRPGPPLWNWVAPTALSQGPQEAACRLASARGLLCRGPQQERREAVTSHWLCELLGTQEKEQQDLPWAALATSDESLKVRKAALGCLCALLEAPPLRQWPDSVSACSRCGPKALLLPAAVWVRLVGPLGFRGAGAGSSSAACCCSLPLRQQHAVGSGAYTSLSKTVSQTAHCALLALFSVLLSHLLELGSCASQPAPALTAAAAGAPSLSAASAADGDAPAASCPRRDIQPPRSVASSPCSAQRSSPFCELEDTGPLAALALRGLAEALPALPLGILQPAMAAAALRVAQPVVLLLVETLQQLQRGWLTRQPPPQQQGQPSCALCLGVETPEANAHEWAALAAQAQAAGQSARRGPLERAAAAAAAGRGVPGHPMDSAASQRSSQLLSSATQLADPKKLCSRNWMSACGVPKPYEVFVSRVVSRGSTTLRLVSPFLALLSAVISRRQRQPQVAEALLLPVSSKDKVPSPSCLAALICQALEVLASLWGLASNPPGCAASREDTMGGGKGPCSVGDPSETTAARAAGDRLGSRKSGDICTSCERHGAVLTDGLFSVLQATAKRYPQVLLLLSGFSASDPATTSEDSVKQTGALGGFSAVSAKDNSFLEMLRLALHCPGLNLRNRAAAVAVEVLGAPTALSSGERGQEESLVGARGLADSPTAKGHAGAVEDVRDEAAILHAPRASLVALLHSSLVVPLLLKSGSSKSAAAALDGRRETPSARKLMELQLQPSASPPAPNPAESPPPELLSSACAILCRLSHVEWQRLALGDRELLQSLRLLTQPSSPRGVRLSAAAALGAFAVNAVVARQEGTPVPLCPHGTVSATQAAAEAKAATTGPVEALGDQGLQEAVHCLLAQLADPVPDVRAAALSSLCEAAGTLQHALQQKLQQQQLQQQSVRDSLWGLQARSLWTQVLKAVNDVLQAGDKAMVAAVGLRALGAAVPLMLLFEAQDKGPSSHRPGERVGTCGAAEAADVESVAAPTASADGVGAKEELLRSLMLLECALRSKGEGAEPSGESPEIESPTSRTKGSSREIVRQEHESREAPCCPETASGLKNLKLHWNACHSIRLIYSSPAASVLLQQDLRRLLPPLWLAACGCLRTSQLAKVRCHAAAALAAMVDLLRSAAVLETSLQAEGAQQLSYTGCMVPLLTEAWRAVEAAAPGAASSNFTDTYNEKPVPRAVLRRYTESLQCNLERLVMSGLMVYTKHFIDEAANNDATRLCRDKRPDAGGLEANLANANPSADRGGEACLSPCDACRAVAQASSSPEMIQALKDAMASALQAGSFSKTAP